MKKFILIILALLPFVASAQNNIKKTAAVAYTGGAPTFTPSISSSTELAVDTVTSKLYWWSRNGSTWVAYPRGFDIISGSSAPAYTPRDNQAIFAINADNEMYYHDGSVWSCVNCPDTVTSVNIGTSNLTTTANLRILTLLKSLTIRGTSDTTGRILLQIGLLKGGRLSATYDSISTYFTGGRTLPRFTAKELYSEQAFSDASGTSRIKADSNGVNIQTTHSADRLTITGKDARYAADYSGTYSLRSLVDKAYVDLQDSINDLDYWTEGYTTSTATTSSFTATSSASNITAAIVPKGNGAFTLAVANGSSSGGNARGTKAVDLQIDRNNAAQVASGTSSVVAGGRRNTASASYSAVGGGSQNAASASTAAISGGDSNTASGTAAFVGAGFSNTSSGDYTVTGGGVTNTASGTNATVGGGFSNTASGNSAVIFGGQGNTASGTYSSVPGGYGAEAYLTGQEAHSATFFSTASDAQRSFILLSREITGTAQTELFLDAGAASVRAILKATNRIWNFEVQVVGTCKTVGNGSGITAGDAWVSWHLGGIKRLNTSTALIGTVQTPATAQSDTGMSTTTVTIDADDTNESLRIRITPPTTAGSTTVTRWIAVVKLAELGY